MQPHHLLILGTTGLQEDTLSQLGLEDAFKLSVKVPAIAEGSQVVTIVKVLIDRYVISILLLASC